MKYFTDYAYGKRLGWINFGEYGVLLLIWPGQVDNDDGRGGGLHLFRGAVKA